MSPHRCYQGPRLTRLEVDAAKTEAKYRERDETVRNALLELGREVAAIGGNVAEQIKGIQNRIDQLALEVIR